MKTNASLLENAPTHIYTSSTCILQGRVSGGATGLEDRPMALPAKRGALLPAHPAPRGAGRRADSKSGHAADPRGGGGHGRTSLWEPSSPSPKDSPAGKLQRQAWGERAGGIGGSSLYCACPAAPVTLSVSLSPSQAGQRGQQQENRTAQVGTQPALPHPALVSS